MRVCRKGERDEVYFMAIRNNIATEHVGCCHKTEIQKRREAVNCFLKKDILINLSGQQFPALNELILTIKFCA